VNAHAHASIRTTLLQTQIHYYEIEDFCGMEKLKPTPASLASATPLSHVTWAVFIIHW
jgi:hypothetical protein